MALSSLDLGELVEDWTLLDEERKQVGDERGPARLGFTLLLKFYTRFGRFPRALQTKAAERKITPGRTGSGGEPVQYIAVPGTPLQQWAGENQMPTQWTTVSSEQQGATQLPLGSRSNQVGAKTA